MQIIKLIKELQELRNNLELERKDTEIYIAAAEEAKIRAKKVQESQKELEFERVMSAIKEESKEGKFEIKCLIQFSNTKSKLEGMGYSVYSMKNTKVKNSLYRITW